MKRKKNSASVGTQKSKVFFFLGEEGSQSPMKMKKKNQRETNQGNMTIQIFSESLKTLK